MLSDVQLYCFKVHCFCSLSDTVFSANLAAPQYIFNTILAILNLFTCFSAKFSTFLPWRIIFLTKQPSLQDTKKNRQNTTQATICKRPYLNFDTLITAWHAVQETTTRKTEKNSEDSHLLYWIVTGKTLPPCDRTWSRRCHIMKQTFYFTYKDCPSKYLHYVVFMNDIIEWLGARLT